MDPKTGIHEPTVTIPWWLDCSAPIGFSKRNPSAWKLIVPMYWMYLSMKVERND